MLEQLLGVLALYKDVPDVDFMLNPLDHPMDCGNKVMSSRIQ
jgi:hypothetical protein